MDSEKRREKPPLPGQVSATLRGARTTAMPAEPKPPLCRATDPSTNTASSYKFKWLESTSASVKGTYAAEERAGGADGGGGDGGDGGCGGGGGGTGGGGGKVKTSGVGTNVVPLTAHSHDEGGTDERVAASRITLPSTTVLPGA